MSNINNRVQLIGNLGNEPAISESQAKGKTARLRLATNESFRSSNGETVIRTHWHNLIAHGSFAELAEQKLTSGAELAIEGKLVHTHFTDSKGQKRHYTVVEITSMQLLGHRA